MATANKLEIPGGRDWISRKIDDPARFYYWPIVGRWYQRRVLACLRRCTGGERILEIGFGSGMTFLTLNRRYGEIHGVDLHAPVAELQEEFHHHGVGVHLQNGSLLDLPYPDGHFDTVLLISILEHLKPEEMPVAFREIRRVLRQGGKVVYGVPVDRPLMTLAFRLLGYDIRKYHFSTEREIASSAEETFGAGRVETLKTPVGPVYQVGEFMKA